MKRESLIITIVTLDKYLRVRMSFMEESFISGNVAPVLRVLSLHLVELNSYDLQRVLAGRTYKAAKYGHTSA